MDPDDHVCLCFRVSLRKVRTFLNREDPPVASRLADCLGAGTGCQWCVPFLQKLHSLKREGEPIDLPISPASYAANRAEYRRSGGRPEPKTAESGEDDLLE
ncbi:MAG: (2Fe-2S)-binding protein [Planctomycetaceae bacterium]|nr:(2Fe-2S)-binding protein [Planctomycetaceae bacterium]